MTSEEMIKASVYGICHVCGSPRGVEQDVEVLMPEMGLLGKVTPIHQGQKQIAVTKRLICPNGHPQDGNI